MTVVPDNKQKLKPVIISFVTIVIIGHERRFVMVIEISPLLLDDEGPPRQQRRRDGGRRLFGFSPVLCGSSPVAVPASLDLHIQPRIDIPAITCACILFWRGVIGQSASFPTFIAKKRYIGRASHRGFVCWIELVKLAINAVLLHFA